MTDLLLLSHVPPLPGSEIGAERAHRMLERLASEWGVHLVCFAPNRAQADAVRGRAAGCASVYTEIVPVTRLLKSAAHFAAGACFTSERYTSRRLRGHIRNLARRSPVRVTVALSAVMAQYAPDGLPLVLDVANLESEQCFEEEAFRPVRWLYRIEGRRLRRLEAWYAARARRTLAANAGIGEILKAATPKARITVLESAIESEADPSRIAIPPALAGRKFLALPVDQSRSGRAEARWFAAEVYPEIRRRDTRIDLIVCGKGGAAVQPAPGISAIGGLADEKTCLACAQAVLALGRGLRVENVIQALALGKLVLASRKTTDAFGGDVPAGLVCCETKPDWVEAVLSLPPPAIHAAIRTVALRRFAWDSNLEILAREVGAAIESVNPLRSAGLA